MILIPFTPPSCRTALSAYMYLKNRANKDNLCFPAIGSPVDLIISKQTVERAHTDFEKAGFALRDSSGRVW